MATSTDPKAVCFPKQINAPPRYPIRRISKNVIIDANNMVYDVWDVNGEMMYMIKFHLPLLFR